MYTIAQALGIFLMLLIMVLILGPVIAGIFALVAFLVLLVFALPVLIVLSPWIVIGFISWLIFF